MPWPFVYPDKFLEKPWRALQYGQRFNLPLIGGIIGQSWLQTGYTMCRCGPAGASEHLASNNAVEPTKREYPQRFVKAGLTSFPDGSVSYWVTVSLPKLLSRADSRLVLRDARPVITVILRPHGWNSVLKLLYEDVCWAKISDRGPTQLSRGVFVSVSVARVLVLGLAIAVILGLVRLGSMPNPELSPVSFLGYCLRP